MGLEENLRKIKEQIGNNNVKIIAVTKYATSQQITDALNLGIYDFGESYVQDALDKIKKLPNECNWHLVGRLQKNKVRYVVGNFSLIHSVDCIELAELIDKEAKKKGVIQKILLQVNITQEPTKSGFSEDGVNGVNSNFYKIINLENIKVLGLMTIGPNLDKKDEINGVKTKSCFLKLVELKSELNNKYNTELRELSMGMSNDYKEAIKCGSTMVRLGRAIFKEEIIK